MMLRGHGFIYLNDTHLRASRPSCRLDEGFYESQLEKMREVKEIKSEHGVPLLHGGDLFHVFNSPLSLISDATAYVRGWRVNPGNHDFVGANTDTMRRSALGVLSTTGVIELAQSERPSRRFCLKTAPYAISYPEDFYWIADRRPDEVWVVMAHDMLTTRPVPFPHKQIKDVRTNADIVLCSHWHSQFMEKVGNTWFVNSGPLDCQTITERHTKPAVVVVEQSVDGKFHPRFEFLKTTGYEKVEIKDEEERDLGLADDFIKEIKSAGLADGADFREAIIYVAKESGYTQSAIDRVLARIEQAQTCVGRE